MIKMTCNICGEKACKWELPTDQSWAEIKAMMEKHAETACPVTGEKVRWEKDGL